MGKPVDSFGGGDLDLVDAARAGGEQTAWRIRVRDYRVVYDVLGEALLATVVRAGHRREICGR